jgi:hypothetical protein
MRVSCRVVLCVCVCVCVVQPCHYLTALLIGTTYSSSTDARLFWFYLYAHWQGYLHRTHTNYHRTRRTR